MSETIIIDKNLSIKELYQALLPQIDSLIDPAEPLISNLSNVSAAIKEVFDKISWVGFYLLKDEKLFLGPFQGKTSCTVIGMGKGVCGSAAVRKKTIIVEDVDKFPGHIACDGRSKSEIVVPLIKDDRVFGVLDLDSYELSSFDTTDQIYLEKLCNSLTTRLNFDLVKTIISV
jgi:L-methionine (R)-S-oxide reductase